MSTFDGTRVVCLGFALALGAASGCGVASDCLRYSDCTAGLTCAYGHCVFPPGQDPGDGAAAEGATGEDSGLGSTGEASSPTPSPDDDASSQGGDAPAE